MNKNKPKPAFRTVSENIVNINAEYWGPEIDKTVELAIQDAVRSNSILHVNKNESTITSYFESNFNADQYNEQNINIKDKGMRC